MPASECQTTAFKAQRNFLPIITQLSGTEWSVDACGTWYLVRSLNLRDRDERHGDDYARHLRRGMQFPSGHLDALRVRLSAFVLRCLLVFTSVLPPCTSMGNRYRLRLISSVHNHDHPMHISNRTCLQDSLLHEPSRRCPMAHGKPVFRRPELLVALTYPSLGRFPSGFAPSLTIPKFGRLCTRFHPSFVPLYHFPPSLSSARSCSRRDWRSRGRQRVYEPCHASVFPSRGGSMVIFTLSAGGGSSCANRTAVSYCMTRRPMQRHAHHRSYGSKWKG
jgi:hypothetical protein